jgi:hypothetical protein
VKRNQLMMCMFSLFNQFRINLISDEEPASPMHASSIFAKSSQISTNGMNDLKRRAASPGNIPKKKSMKERCKLFKFDSDSDQAVDDSIVLDSDDNSGQKYNPAVGKSRQSLLNDSIVIDDSDEDDKYNPIPVVVKSRPSLSNDSKFIADSDEEEIKRPSFYGNTKAIAPVKSTVGIKSAKNKFKFDSSSSGEDIDLDEDVKIVSKPVKKTATSRKKRTSEEIEEEKLVKAEAKRVKDEEKVECMILLYNLETCKSSQGC